MEIFHLKPEIVSGDDALDTLRTLHSSRTLVVTDGFWTASGGISHVVDRLSGQVRVFDQIAGEPTTETVAKGTAVFREFRPEAMVALGGGSVVDGAKAIRKFALPEGETIPLWALPTTAGTGSEVTSFAVIGENGVKVPLVEEALLPDRAVLWGGFLETLPGGVVADSGMDALSHGLEAYVSAGATPFSDALAREAVSLIWHRLPLAVQPGTGHARSELLTASCMAGVAFNNGGLGICHGLSHAIGGRFHLPHGKVNSILLPAVIAWNGEGAAMERYAALARSCGLTSGSGKPALWSLIRGIRRLRQRLNLPETMTQAGVSRGEYLAAVPQLAQSALADICTRTNPRPATQEALEQLLREVM